MLNKEELYDCARKINKCCQYYREMRKLTIVEVARFSTTGLTSRDAYYEIPGEMK